MRGKFKQRGTILSQTGLKLRFSPIRDTVQDFSTSPQLHKSLGKLQPGPGHDVVTVWKTNIKARCEAGVWFPQGHGEQGRTRSGLRASLLLER